MSIETKIKRNYKHKGNGEKYYVINHRAKVKIEGKWHRAIVYCGEPNGQIYVRTVDNFLERFVEI